MKKFSFVLLICCVFMMMFSCSTLQEDIEIYTSDETESPEILNIEKDVVYWEAKKFQGDVLDLVKIQEISRKIDKLVGSVNLQTALQSKLYALQGRLSLITGKNADAKAFYEQATKTYKGEVHTVILGRRLGLIENFENQFVAKSQQPLLTLETAIELYQKEDYIKAVASFDEAFISLEDFYQEYYGELRNIAWKLREISSETSVVEADILKLDSINLYQMLFLTQKSTDFLFKYTASKKYSEDALVKQIINAGLLNPINAEDVDAKSLNKNTVVTRQLAARFLWNLYLERNGLSRDVIYGEQFKMVGFSPIGDLDLESPDFDAILGCIEKELMELIDGESFLPDSPIEAIEFNKSLKQIK